MQWLPPCKPNGIIEFFQLNFTGVRPGFEDHTFGCKVSELDIQNLDIIEYTVSNLKPEFNYTITGTVQIKNISQQSQEISINFLSPAGS